MGLFNKLFGKASKKESLLKKERKDQPDIYYASNDSDPMNWAIEKAQLTLHYFTDSLLAPKPEQMYFSVKAALKQDQETEHIWLNDPEFVEGKFRGKLGNVPAHITSVSIGDFVEISNEEVSDWMIIENGRLIGGYTIRAVRNTMSGKDLEAFDRSVGMIIDAGADYFKHDMTTPEGALLSLEDAYDQQDMDKAIACKDFVKEAQLMLERVKGGVMAKNQKLVDTTAEALKLSFMKMHMENGFPSFKGVQRAFERMPVNDELMVLREYCLYPDGERSRQDIRICKEGQEWRVLNTVG